MFRPSCSAPNKQLPAEENSSEPLDEHQPAEDTSLPVALSSSNTADNSYTEQQIDSLYWRHNTATFLYHQDQAAFGAGFLFLCFVINTLDFDPAYIVCGCQMVVQLFWMLLYPDSYKARRDSICLAIRIWRTIIVYRMSSQFGCQLHAMRPVLRSLLVASGSLVNFVVAIGYQLKFSVHIKMQVFQVLVSILAGTKNVADFVNREENVSFVNSTYQALSSMSTGLMEGMGFSGLRVLGCSPDFGLSVVLFSQIFLGFVIPSYLLFILENSARNRFKSRLLSTSPPQHNVTTAVDKLSVAVFSTMAHTLVLAIMGSLLWEGICCGICMSQVEGPFARRKLSLIGAVDGMMGHFLGRPLGRV